MKLSLKGYVLSEIWHNQKDVRLKIFKNNKINVILSIYTQNSRLNKK